MIQRVETVDGSLRFFCHSLFTNLQHKTSSAYNHLKKPRKNNKNLNLAPLYFQTIRVCYAGKLLSSLHLSDVFFIPRTIQWFEISNKWRSLNLSNLPTCHWNSTKGNGQTPIPWIYILIPFIFFLFSFFGQTVNGNL